NPDGYLASIANPANEAYQLSYTPEGLLTGLVEPRGGPPHVYTYDGSGRLTRDDDPVGGHQLLARIDQGNSYTVTVTSALTHTTSYGVVNLPNGDQQRITIAPSGARTDRLVRTDGTSIT